MRGSAVRRKSVPLSQAKLTRLRTILGAKTDAEAVDRALTIAIADAVRHKGQKLPPVALRTALARKQDWERRFA